MPTKDKEKEAAVLLKEAGVFGADNLLVDPPTRGLSLLSAPCTCITPSPDSGHRHASSDGHDTGAAGDDAAVPTDSAVVTPTKSGPELQAELLSAKKEILRLQGLLENATNVNEKLRAKVARVEGDNDELRAEVARLHRGRDAEGSDDEDDEDASAVDSSAEPTLDDIVRTMRSHVEKLVRVDNESNGDGDDNDDEPPGKKEIEKPRKIVKARRYVTPKKYQSMQESLPNPESPPMPIDIISKHLAPCLPVGAELTNICIAVGPMDATMIRQHWLRTYEEEYLAYSLGLYTTYPFPRPDRKEKCRNNILSWMKVHDGWRNHFMCGDLYSDVMTTITMQGWRAEQLQFGTHTVQHPGNASLAQIQTNPLLLNAEQVFESHEFRYLSNGGCSLSAVSAPGDDFIPCKYKSDFSDAGSVMRLDFDKTHRDVILSFYKDPDMMFSNPLVALDLGLSEVVAFLVEEEGLGLRDANWRGVYPREKYDRMNISLFEYAVEQDGVSAESFEALIRLPSLTSNATMSFYSLLLRDACTHLHRLSDAEAFKRKDTYKCVLKKMKVLLDLGANPLVGDNGQVFGPNNPFANVKKLSQEDLRHYEISELWRELCDLFNGGLCFGVKL